MIGTNFPVTRGVVTSVGVLAALSYNPDMPKGFLITDSTLDAKVLRGHCSKCGQVFSEVTADDLGSVSHQFEVHVCIDTQRLRRGLFQEHEGE